MNVCSLSRTIVSPLLVTLLPALLAADNWPSWRGPRGNGISSDTAPVRWSRTENVKWKLPLPGRAGATPVVWGKHIFLTSAEGEDLVLICVSTDGKQRWKRTVGTGDKQVRGDEGNFASPSPITDGTKVWTFMGNGILACYDFDGDLVWKTDLQKRYGTFEIQFGLTSTPVLERGRLYLQLIHGKWSREPSRGTVLALDASNGEEVWKRPRATDAIDECKHSYASPITYTIDGESCLVTHGADYAIAYKLLDGSEVWRCGNLNPKDNYNHTLRFVASPAAGDGIVVVPTAKGGKVVAVDLKSAKGDITDSKEAVRWVMPRGTPDVPSPLIHDGVVYLCRENGALIALDAKSGEKLYEERTVRDRHRASPILSDGKIYLTARNGTVTVVKAGREFEIIARNEIGEPTTASPAISNGTLYLRSYDTLWAIGK